LGLDGGGLIGVDMDSSSVNQRFRLIGPPFLRHGLDYIREPTQKQNQRDGFGKRCRDRAVFLVFVNHESLR
jgi:hypothetical protein